MKKTILEIDSKHVVPLESVERREFLQRGVVVLSSCFITGNLLVSKDANAFLPGLFIRFVARSLFRGAARSVSRSAIRSYRPKPSSNGRSKIKATSYNTRSMKRSNNKNQEVRRQQDRSSLSFGDALDLADFLTKDVIWTKNNVPNEASLIVTNYQNRNINSNEVEFRLKDQLDGEIDLVGLMENFVIPANSEMILNFTVENLPRDGIKRLESSNTDHFSSGRILVADDTKIKRGMTVEELYQQFISS